MSAPVKQVSMEVPAGLHAGAPPVYHASMLDDVPISNSNTSPFAALASLHAASPANQIYRAFPESMLICPISQQLMQKPVVAADGITYDKKSFLQHIQSGKKVSPVTKKPLSNFLFTRNVLVQNLLRINTPNAPAEQVGDAFADPRYSLLTATTPAGLVHAKFDVYEHKNNVLPLVETNETTDLELKDFTFRAIVKPTVAALGMIFSRDELTVAENQFRLEITPDRYVRVAGLGVPSVPPSVQPSKAIDEAGWSSALISLTPLELNQWYHIVLTRADGGREITLYINGAIHGRIIVEKPEHHSKAKHVHYRLGCRHGAPGSHPQTVDHPFYGHIKHGELLIGRAQSLDEVSIDFVSNI